MGLFEFFFPEHAQAEQLSQIARTQQLLLRRTAAQRPDLAKRVSDLEHELGYVTLVLGSILRKLDAKGVVTREDVKQEISQLDAIDGVKDGRLDIVVLREMFESR